MKKLLLAVLITSLICNVSFGQIKLYTKDKKEKAKGVYSQLKLDKKLKKNEGKAAVGAAVITTAIPVVYNILKSATSRDEADYKAELSSLNSVNFKNIYEKVFFSITQTYYLKKDGKPKTASVYKFELNFDKPDVIKIKLGDVQDNAMLVKTRNKKDFVFTAIEVTLKAFDTVIIEKKSGKKVEKIATIDLGKHTFQIINTSFNSDNNQVIKLNDSSCFHIPTVDDKGNELKIFQILVSTKINQSNPYGLTVSGFNEFLVNNSDANVAFLKAVLGSFLPSDEETDE